MKLAGVPLGRFPHVCALVGDRDEETVSLHAFIRQGIDRGEKAFHILNRAKREEHLDRLRGAGLDVDALQRSGQLEVATWDQFPPPGGTFDQDTTIAAVLEILDRAKEDGYRLTRLICAAPWGEEGRPDVENFMTYEARLSDPLRDYEDPVICVYDRNKLSGPLMVDVLRTHPVVVVDGAPYPNPVFAPPRWFM
jgi:hypothetical protein